MMDEGYDIEVLRQELKDHYGAASAVFDDPLMALMAIHGAFDADTASDDEIVEKARSLGLI